jgi:hypothetical protein
VVAAAVKYRFVGGPKNGQTGERTLPLYVVPGLHFVGLFMGIEAWTYRRDDEQRVYRLVRRRVSVNWSWSPFWDNWQVTETEVYV